MFHSRPSKLVRRLVPGALMVLATAAFGPLSQASTPALATATDWPGYLAGPEHSSTSPSTAITVSNAAALRRGWSFHAAKATTTGQPAPLFTASPTVYGGRVYIGSNTGVFYAVDATTGKTVWSKNLGFVRKLTCGARGITSTASVAVSPATGKATVYVGGGNGYMYALDAVTGQQRWKTVVGGVHSTTVNDYYNWSSPAVANGHVYYGITSQCDNPFVRGGLVEFDQSTGATQGVYYAVGPTDLGAGVWTSPAVAADGKVYATTASAKAGTFPGDSYSMVQVSGTDMSRLAGWQVPASQQVGDSDWGGSPTIFQSDLGTGTPSELVGGCNKNGLYYAFRTDSLAAGPVWQYQVGLGTKQGQLACLGAAIWDGSRLFVPGNSTMINGTAYSGSMRQLDPESGRTVWETGLSAIVLGSPSINANGVIAAATYGLTGANGVYLIDAATGVILKFYETGKEFSQPVYAGNNLFVATGNTLTLLHP